jgi:uncharacterized protein (UPF0332 family)
MEVNAQANIEEWTVSASYYAKYFSVYALLSKIGVRCEIHDCTIALFGYLFSSAGYDHLVRELKQCRFPFARCKDRARSIFAHYAEH